MKYYKRIADELLSDKLEYCGAVEIRGPKWCGKSTTAEQHAGSIVYMQDQKTKKRNKLLCTCVLCRFSNRKTVQAKFPFAPCYKKSNKIHSVTEVSLEDYAYLLCRGGWPQIMQLSKKNALHLANNFYDGLLKIKRIRSASSECYGPMHVRNQRKPLSTH